MILEAFIKIENKKKNYINLDLEQKQLLMEKNWINKFKDNKTTLKINMNIYTLKKGKFKLREKRRWFN